MFNNDFDPKSIQIYIDYLMQILNAIIGFFKSLGGNSAPAADDAGDDTATDD